MAYTIQQLSDIRNMILLRLNEPANTTAGDLPSGTGGAATIATTAELTKLVNDVCADLARTCVPLTGTGTYALTLGTAGVAFVNLNSFTTSDNSLIHTPYDLVWDTTQLRYAGELPYLRNKYPTYLTDAAATPTDWGRDGKTAIWLYPYPSTSKTITATAYIVPTLESADADKPSWLPADLYDVIVNGCCASIVGKNLEDDSLAIRSVWAMNYARQKMALWAAMPETTRRDYFPVPPGAVPQAE